MIRNLETGRLDEWVNAARQGDRHACEHLVRETQARSLAAAYGVLRDAAAAQDAVQLAYLRAFRRLHELREPAAFGGWLRRIVITAALNLRRAHRHSHACLDDMPEMPVLDDAEDRWSGEQRQRLSVALLSLGSEERRTCDRHYHGGWSMARLAAAAGIDELAMRKRMQRIRQKLRKLLEQEEIQMAKNSGIDPERLVADLPHRVAELLARP